MLRRTKHPPWKISNEDEIKNEWNDSEKKLLHGTPVKWSTIQGWIKNEREEMLDL